MSSSFPKSECESEPTLHSRSSAATMNRALFRIQNSDVQRYLDYINRRGWPTLSPTSLRYAPPLSRRDRVGTTDLFLPLNLCPPSMSMREYSEMSNADDTSGRA